MKVRELIVELSKYPQDCDVKYWVNCYETLEEVTKVELECDCVSLA